MNDNNQLPDDAMITVCASCMRAGCWQGAFYCDDNKRSHLIEKSVTELAKMSKEHPDYWMADWKKKQ